jgi:phage FluMu gp28-like protein
MTDDPIIKFLPYQRALLDDKSRFIATMWSRQIGKTFTNCAKIVDHVIQQEALGRATKWWILSRAERQAAEAIRENVTKLVKAFFHLYGSAAAASIGEIEEGVPTIDGEPTYKRLEVTFPGGSRITALPANPDTVVGISGNLYLDEFGLHRESRRLFGVLFPVVSAGDYQLLISSSPRGKGNKFYEIISGADDGWSRHIVDIHEAVRQGLKRDVPMLRKILGDEDLWRQEFEVQFLDEASSWLSYDLISAAEHPEAGDPARYTGGPCFVGVDIAARNDLFVVWVAEMVGDVLWTREIFTARRLSFAGQDAELARVMQTYRVVRCAIDQTGMGEKPVEDAKRLHGSSRVEGVLFSAARKLDMATALKERLEDRTLRLPAGDPLLRADLHAIRKQAGLTGQPRLVADGDTDGHADRFWAGALAAAAAHSPHQPYAYQPVRRPVATPAGLRDRDDDDRRGAGFGRHRGVI